MKILIYLLIIFLFFSREKNKIAEVMNVSDASVAGVICGVSLEMLVKSGNLVFDSLTGKEEKMNL